MMCDKRITLRIAQRISSLKTYSQSFLCPHSFTTRIGCRCVVCLAVFVGDSGLRCGEGAEGPHMVRGFSEGKEEVGGAKRG